MKKLFGERRKYVGTWLVKKVEKPSIPRDKATQKCVQANPFSNPNHWIHSTEHTFVPALANLPPIRLNG
jgi:hypothetical protein